MYDPIYRYAKRKRSFFDAVNQSVGIILANSIHPLRLFSAVGLFLSVSNVFYTFYIIGVYFLKRDVASGWTTISLQNSVMFACLFLILAIMCEYLGRILEESKNRPQYYVAEEKNSSVAIKSFHSEQRNIVHDSERIKV